MLFLLLFFRIRAGLRSMSQFTAQRKNFKDPKRNGKAELYSALPVASSGVFSRLYLYAISIR